MHKALDFLKLLKEAIPTDSEHKLILHEGGLMAVVASGRRWETFVIDESDLDRDPAELVADVARLWAALARDGEGMTEAGAVIGEGGRVVHWHIPEGTTAGSIPDTDQLWEVLRTRRDEVVGFAHSHPAGVRSPSWEDLTTFSALERGLAKRFIWWICTGDSLSEVRWNGPGAHDYVTSAVSPGGEPAWADDLRIVSGIPPVRVRRS